MKVRVARFWSIWQQMVVGGGGELHQLCHPVQLCPLLSPLQTFPTLATAPNCTSALGNGHSKTPPAYLSQICWNSGGSLSESIYTLVKATPFVFDILAFENNRS